MSDMGEKTEAFRRNVREMLDLKGMTRVELARRSGLSRPWLSGMLNGKAIPSLLTCERIARALVTPLEVLIASPPSPRYDPGTVSQKEGTSGLL